MNEIYQTYLEAVKALCPKLTTEELVYFGNGLTITNLNAKHFYIQGNSIQKEIGYVYSGLLRAFYIDHRGEEITVEFIPQGKFATHYPALVSGTPGKFYFQCLEPSTIININYQHMIDCCDKFPSFERYVRLMVEDAFFNQRRRVDSFIFESAEERYLNFIKQNPDLFNRISLTHLSSYIGIERQSLTRIRKKLVQK